jgi:hypothetical protein
MARVQFVVNEILYWDRALAARFEREIAEAAAPAAEPPAGRLECRLLVDGYVDRPAPKYVDLQFSVPGWVTRFSVVFQTPEGDVRNTVEKVLRYRGILG